MQTTPSTKDTTARLAVTLARVAEEVEHCAWRAAWQQQVGGHAAYMVSRATRYSAAAARLQAARERLAA